MTSGWIILDKENGLFSRTACNRLGRLFGVKKTGHIGTLDPMATGVLPIAIGDATKMIPYVEQVASGKKEYLFSIRFGCETDTLDITGHVIKKTDIIPNKNDIISILPSFVGDLQQIPPMFSAVHVNGIRAYKLAREGIVTKMKPRPVKIFSLVLTDVCGDIWTFRMQCSVGTYVRSIARDIAYACNSLATVTMIRRTFTNGFGLENSVKLDFLENLFNNGGDVNKYLAPIDLGLGDIPVLNLDKSAVLFYKNGGFIEMCGCNGLKRVYCDNDFIGIGEIVDNILRPKRTI